eukprot:2131618-Pyramimonas_sp.AAC.1
MIEVRAYRKHVSVNTWLAEITLIAGGHSLNASYLPRRWPAFTDPNFDALIVALYGSLEEFEAEEEKKLSESTSKYLEERKKEIASGKNDMMIVIERQQAQREREKELRLAKRNGEPRRIMSSVYLFTDVR